MNLTIKNGIYIVEVPVSDFKITMVDERKKNIGRKNICNASFFAGYDEGGTHFTLPVGHLRCDFAATNPFVRRYCTERGIFKGNKFTFDSFDWGYQNQFKGKAVSTLCVVDGHAYIDEMTHPAANSVYAIAGVPIVRNGADVSFTTFVKKQGWDGSTLYGTWHVFLGLKEANSDKIYVVGMKTTSGNMVLSAEAYRKFSALGFRDVIKLDGGGSYYLNADGKVSSTSENRRISTIIEFGPTAAAQSATTAKPEEKTNVNPYKTPTTTIRYGSGSKESIKWLQWELNRHGYICDVDGSFGPATDRLVRKYQKDHGLSVDGSVGPATRAALMK